MNAISDILALTWRNLIRYTRIPQLLVFSTIQPVMYILLFTYVFGGAIQTPGIDYVNYLIPGILVQTVIFGAIQTGIGLSDDLSRGMIDRFNSLPITRAAVLSARTLADTARNIFVLTLMIGVALLIGFEFQGTLLDTLIAFATVLLFGFAFSWVSANIGFTVRDPETAQVAGFIWVFPLVFASSTFVPVETMPDLLEAFAKVNPISIIVNAVRALLSGQDVGSDLLKTFAWIATLLLIFVPLAVLRYKRAT